ncbi:MAG: sensor histidine kinase [Chthoniobacterales bacterium]
MSELSNEQPVQSAADLHVPMRDVVRFVRQLSHDLRNHLNAAELQSAYIHEVAADAELKEETKRLRMMLSEIGASLQRLTAALAEVKLTRMPYAAASFLEDLRQKIGVELPEQSSAIEWDISLNAQQLEIDPQLLQQAFLELFTNAFQHQRGDGPLRAAAEIHDGNLSFTLREPKTSFRDSAEKWGREPFRDLKHGHYGLGLLRVRSIIEAHQGCLNAHFDPSSSSLVTTVVLPLAQHAH